MKSEFSILVVGALSMLDNKSVVEAPPNYETNVLAEYPFHLMHHHHDSVSLPSESKTPIEYARSLGKRHGRSKERKVKK